MRTVRRLWALLPALVLWAFLSVMVWGFVFGRITDTDAAHKVTLYCDAAVPGDRALAVALEKALTGDNKMVQVHPFSYAMFDSDAIRSADLYIIRVPLAEDYLNWVRPLPEGMAGENAYMIDGVAWGIPVYDVSEGLIVGGEYIDYAASGDQVYCLFFGAKGLHVSGNEGAVDDAAKGIAEALLQMR